MTSTLLQTVNMGDSADHSISITGATSGKTLIAFLVAPATIVLHSDSVTAGWVQDAYAVNTIGLAVFRLNTTLNVGGTQTLRVTHNGSRALAGSIIQSDAVGSPSLAQLNEVTGGGSLSAWATDADTFADEECFAVFGSAFTGEVTDESALSYDNGFTAISDSLFVDSTAGENMQMFVGYKVNAALTATAVNVTLNQPISSLARVAGIMAYNVPAPPASAWKWTYGAKVG